MSPRSTRASPPGVGRRIGPAGLPRRRRAARRLRDDGGGGCRHPARPAAHARARAAGRRRRHRRVRDRRASCTSARRPLDADLARVRGLLGGTELTLERSASPRAAARHRDGAAAAAQQARARRDGCRLLRPRGAAPHARRGLGRRRRPSGRSRPSSCAELGALGYFVNEFGISDVVHAHRDRRRPGGARPRPRGRRVGRARPRRARSAAIIARLAERHLGVALGAGDLQHLSTLVLTRVVAPGAGGAGRRRPRRGSIPTSRRRSARSSRRAAAEFLVDIAARGLHPASRPARAEPPAPLARAGVVAQSAHAVAQVDVPDDLRGRGLHRERPAASASASRCSTTRSPTSRCTSAAGSSAAGRPTSCSPRRSCARATTSCTSCCARRSTARSARRSRSSASRRASTRTGRSIDTDLVLTHDRPGRRRRPLRAHPAVPHRRRRRARAGRRRAHPPGATARAAARRSSSATSSPHAFVRGLDADGARRPSSAASASLLVARGRDRRGLRRAHDPARAALLHRVHRRARRAARAWG